MQQLQYNRKWLEQLRCITATLASVVAIGVTLYETLNIMIPFFQTTRGSNGEDGLIIFIILAYLMAAISLVGLIAIYLDRHLAKALFFISGIIVLLCCLTTYNFILVGGLLLLLSSFLTPSAKSQNVTL